MNFIFILGDQVNSHGDKRARKNVQFEMLKNFNFEAEALIEKVFKQIPGQINEFYK